MTLQGAGGAERRRGAPGRAAGTAEPRGAAADGQREARVLGGAAARRGAHARGAAGAPRAPRALPQQQGARQPEGLPQVRAAVRLLASFYITDRFRDYDIILFGEIFIFYLFFYSIHLPTLMKIKQLLQMFVLYVEIKCKCKL